VVVNCSSRGYYAARSVHYSPRNNPEERSSLRKDGFHDL